MTEEEFKNSPKNPFTLILDNIRSLHNVGAAFRTADAFRAEKIYLCGITGTPPNREINKTALGATETVPWEYSKDTLLILEQLKSEGYVIAAIEQTDKSINLHEFTPDPEKKYAFIFGNEVFGVDQNLLPSVNLCLEIPQFGTKHSLNVSVAIGIISWHYILGLSKQ